MLQRSDFTSTTSSSTTSITKTAFPSAAKKNNDGNGWKRSAEETVVLGNAKRQRCLIDAIPDGMQIDDLPTSTTIRKMAVPVSSSIMLDNDNNDNNDNDHKTYDDNDHESIMMMINPQDYYEDKWD
jgi:hypothetical protein